MKNGRKDYRLSSETFLALTNAFRENGWDIPDENAGLESRFNRFCERLSLFETSKQMVIIELTKRFTVINSTDYLRILISLLDRLSNTPDCSLASTKKAFIYPLISPNDFEKTKSSKFVWYMMREEQVQYHRLLLGKELIYCEINQASWAINAKSDEKILLVDDYIGSGETATSAICWFEREHGIVPSQIVILALAGQQTGISQLQALGVDVYTFHSFERGISDYYEGNELTSNTIAMENIEKQIKVDSGYEFGYKRSEALISLIRTPNNTFPVFWKKIRKGNIAPFQRN